MKIGERERERKEGGRKKRERFSLRSIRAIDVRAFSVRDGRRAMRVPRVKYRRREETGKQNK